MGDDVNALPLKVFRGVHQISYVKANYKRPSRRFTRIVICAFQHEISIAEFESRQQFGSIRNPETDRLSVELLAFVEFFDEKDDTKLLREFCDILFHRD